MVAENFDGFLEAAGEVEGVPVVEVGVDGVEVDDTIFDHHAIDSDVWVEVHASSKTILNPGDGCRAVRQIFQTGVVVRMLGQIQRVPVLGMADTKDEVNHFGATFLPVLDGFWRVRMWTQFCSSGNTSTCFTASARLPKYTGTISKSIPYRRTKLPKNLPQTLFKIFIDLDVLVVSKVAVREV